MKDTLHSNALNLGAPIRMTRMPTMKKTMLVGLGYVTSNPINMFARETHGLMRVSPLTQIESYIGSNFTCVASSGPSAYVPICHTLLDNSVHEVADLHADVETNVYVINSNGKFQVRPLLPSELIFEVTDRSRWKVISKLVGNLYILWVLMGPSAFLANIGAKGDGL